MIEHFSNDQSHHKSLATDGDYTFSNLFSRKDGSVSRRLLISCRQEGFAWELEASNCHCINHRLFLYPNYHLIYYSIFIVKFVQKLKKKNTTFKRIYTLFISSLNKVGALFFLLCSSFVFAFTFVHKYIQNDPFQKTFHLYTIVYALRCWVWLVNLQI